MAQFLIVAKADGLDEYRKIADEYGVGFEYNDFYMPDLLDDNLKLQSVMDRYRTVGVPEYCTMHGAFFDIIPFSNDSAIRRVSLERMKESMEIAEKMGFLTCSPKKEDLKAAAMEKLGQGYSYTADASGKKVTGIGQVKKGDLLSIWVLDGQILAEVKDINKTDEGNTP